MLQACVSLMRQLYARDLRRAFCPDGHWISQSVTMSLAMDRPSDATLRRRSRLRQHYRPFNSVLAFTQEELGKHHHKLYFFTATCAERRHELHCAIAPVRINESLMLFSEPLFMSSSFVVCLSFYYYNIFCDIIEG